MKRFIPFISAIAAALFHLLLMVFAGGVGSLLMEAGFMLVTGIIVFFIVRSTMKQLP